MKIKSLLYSFIAILIFLSSSVPFYAYDDSCDNLNQLSPSSAVLSTPVSSAETTQDLDSAALDYGILIADPKTGDVIFTKGISDPELLEAESLQPGTILKSLSSEILIAVTEYEANKN